MKTLLFPALLLLFHCFLQAQPRHIIYFKHKGATTYTLSTASQYLSQRAIDRRTRYAIAIDSADLPVPSSFIAQVQAITGVQVLNVSRWLNAITVQVSDPNAINNINALPFVQSSIPVANRPANLVTGHKDDILSPVLPTTYQRPQQAQSTYFDYGANSFNEIHLHKGEFLHNIGLRGQAMQIALLDLGFSNYTNLHAMDSIVTNAQVLSTWDFVKNETSVTEDGAHGMMCLSIIAANMPGQFIGKAPKAFFHLFRTEDDASESPVEEFNWVCGAERADSIGADIISSSLGYNTFDMPALNYSYTNMDGKSTIAVKGADKAAAKGLLVLNAVGNSGSGTWHYLLTPADGDSVVAVGAVNTAGAVWPSSSYGPTSDGRIKPDIASIGYTAMLQGTGNTIISGNGTSYACPNMAGLATCLWQGFPEFNNMRIARALKEAGNLFATPNDRIGYGIPDLKLAFSTLLTEFATSSVVVSSCNATLNWTSKDIDAMKYEIERKAPGEASFTKIAEINPSAGNILSNHNYQFNNTLTNTSTGMLSYRIREVIDTSTVDFTAVYIDTATINLANACTPTATIDINPDADKIMIVPNPAGSNTALIVRTRKPVREMNIVIYDMKGTLVSQLKRSIAGGLSTIDLPISQFAKGKYVVRVFDKQRLIGFAELLKL